MLQPVRDPKTEAGLKIMVPGYGIIKTKAVGALSGHSRGDHIHILGKLLLEHGQAVFAQKPFGQLQAPDNVSPVLSFLYRLHICRSSTALSICHLPGSSPASR